MNNFATNYLNASQNGRVWANSAPRCLSCEFCFIYLLSQHNKFKYFFLIQYNRYYFSTLNIPKTFWERADSFSMITFHVSWLSDISCEMLLVHHADLQ